MKWKKKLSDKYKNIFTHVNIAKKEEFRLALQENFGYIPILNEIDLIFQEKDGKLRAVEIKFFQIIEHKIKGAFYAGIGQALTLLRYGFDNVALWHFFPGEEEKKYFDKNGVGVWSFLRNEINLPIEFTYFKVKDYLNHPEFIVMDYNNNPTTGKELMPIDSPEFKIKWRHPNPMLYKPQTKVIRKALTKSLLLLQ